MTRGPFYQKLPVTDRAWMLILPGRGFPRFLFLFFSLFFLRVGQAGRRESPCSCRRGSFSAPSPSCLPRAPRQSQPSQASVHLHETFWGPPAPPRCPGCCRQEGARFPLALSPPQRWPQPVSSPSSARGRRALPSCLASAPKTLGFGLALAN